MRRALILGLLLVAASCGGGGGDGSGAAKAADVTTTTAKVATAGVTTTAAAKSAATEGTTTVPSTSTSTTAPGSSAAPAATGPMPLPAGTYRYKQTGSSTAGTQRYDAPAEGTMTVKAAAADGTQTLQRYIDPKGDPSDVVMQFRADGMFLLQTVLRQGGQEVKCTFGRGVPSPSWPPKVGANASGRGTCDNYNLVVDITSSITGTKPVSIDGASYTAYVVESTIKTSGQLTSETKQVDWFVAELRLSTHTEQTSKGKFGTFDFSSQGTSDLVSAKPQ